MTFGEAIDHLKHNDGKATRPSWNGKDMFIALQIPDQHSKMRRPYIFMSHADGVLGPWNATQSDMLAEDWETA